MIDQGPLGVLCTGAKKLNLACAAVDDDVFVYSVKVGEKIEEG